MYILCFFLLLVFPGISEGASWGDGTRSGAQYETGEEISKIKYELIQETNPIRNFDNGDEVLIPIELENTNWQHLLCTIAGSIKVSNGEHTDIISSYVYKAIIRRNSGRRQTFRFDKNDYGEGYFFISDSQEYQASCFVVDLDDLPMVPDPIKYCHPVREKCDWLEKGSQI